MKKKVISAVVSTICLAVMSISPCVASATNVDSGYVSYNTTGYSHTMHHTYNNDNTVLSSHYNYVSKSGNTVKSDILCIYAHNEVTGYKYAEIKYGGATYTSGGATGQISNNKSVSLSLTTPSSIVFYGYTKSNPSDSTKLYTMQYTLTVNP